MRPCHSTLTRSPSTGDVTGSSPATLPPTGCDQLEQWTVVESLSWGFCGSLYILDALDPKITPSRPSAPFPN
ncbi:hypothetical protein ASPCADRAFT_203511, partial [Aspergillus carbonarius ITEM 5010]